MRKAAPRTPRWLARLVRSLLRAKPRSRPGSAQLVRRLLERKLGAFPTDAKLELASFLWEEGVFQPREGDTVVLAARAPEGAGARRLRRLALAAGLAGALALAAHDAAGERARACARRAGTRRSVTRAGGRFPSRARTST